MTPRHLLHCLRILRWSNEELAAVLECDGSLIAAWVLGDEEIPPKAAAWIQALVNLHQAMVPEKPKSIKGRKAKGSHLH